MRSDSRRKAPSPSPAASSSRPGSSPGKPSQRSGAPAPGRLPRGLEFLEEILSQPSAPFREGHVIRVLTEAFDEAGVPWFEDSVGNLVVGAASEKEYLTLLRPKKAGAKPPPLRLFIAHLDHPGFHGSRWVDDTTLEVLWHGGSPTQHLEGAKVWLADRQNTRAEGSLTAVVMTPSGRAIQKAHVRLPAPLAASKKLPATDVFGGLGFRAPVWEENERIYTKAADDLVGSYAIAQLALTHLARGKKKPGKRSQAAPFIGLLTRAEEVGYIGALGHLEAGYLAKARREILCISLETSRALPGAEIGKGPVVRQGDRFGVFHPEASRAFALLAQKTLPDRHQKRVMDGGTCEATTTMVYGFPTVGISVPLGNYHNTSFEGGPDSAGPLGPAPEFVHLKDLEGLLKLCEALLNARFEWQSLFAREKKTLQKLYRSYRKLIHSSA
jgi:putative aminopeptidase FrvX